MQQNGQNEQQQRLRYLADEESDVLPHQQGGVRASGVLASRAKARDVQPADETLYEAFNDLQAMAQRYDKPFEAPAILVLGHQTDGKSALVEALIGFQFNQVGGGTTTRRPIVLQLQYDPMALQPTCVVTRDDGIEQAMSITELQAYIQAANAQLEEQQQFSPKELIVNIKYKYAPNLCIIDTPGLIAAAPGKAHAGAQAASRAIESLVRAKADNPSLILLCLEDVNDWSHATTRRLVMQADPQLARTILVSTKLDTRIGTFSRPGDIEAFLHPSNLGSMLGGAPFFTSVPAGRVGSDPDALFGGNIEFRGALTERESLDVCELETRLGRRLDSHERCHLGVSSLRSFLESLLRERYLDQVPAILKALEKEQRTVQQQQAEKRSQLSALNQADLKAKGRRLTEDFITHLSSLLHGNARPPVDKFGQTLESEHSEQGRFTLPNGTALPVSEAVPNANMRLYGGAQFHRAMAEFRMTVGQMACPDVSREEVANACGLDEAHDGANYLRAACVIAVAKARAVLEPFLMQLGRRLSHVLRNMLPATLALLETVQDSGLLHSQDENTIALVKVVGDHFNDFIEKVEASCRARCLEDLLSTTRFVSWSLHTRGAKSLKTMLSKVKVPESSTPQSKSGKDQRQQSDGMLSPSALADLLLEVLFSRQISETSEGLVEALVSQMFEGIRDYCVQSAELKFWCFFLMPVVDTFPSTLRAHMESLYETNLDRVFNTSKARAALEQTLQELDNELKQVEKLLAKFSGVQSTLAQYKARPALQQTPGSAGATTGSVRQSVNGFDQAVAANNKDVVALRSNSPAPPGASSSPLKAVTPLTNSINRLKVTMPTRATSGDDTPGVRDTSIKAMVQQQQQVQQSQPAAPKVISVASAAAQLQSR